MDKEDVIHTHVLPSYKKELNNAICNTMNRPRHYHTKWSKSNRERQMISFLCGILKKKDTNELIYKTETDSQT